ncbi:MAG: ABC transporter ATP-binding protein [Thermoprotei archaeon]|jgi:branched-chain amino acid transport system ATP-binding protein/urea transport system ATP-binding protein
MLSIENLDAYYGKAHILHKINLSIDKGDLLTVVGRNGVGKTTLLKAIMGLEVTKNGRILFRGKDISNLKTHEISKLGIFYIPDDAGLFQGMSVYENLLLAAGRKDIDLSSLEEIYPEIRGLLNRRADLLSGGERKIIAILRSLLTKTDLMLLDEPTEGVMPIMIKRIYNMLDMLRKKGKTIIIVEPGTKFRSITEIATKVTIMSGGRVVYMNDKENALKEIDVIRKYLFI